MIISDKTDIAISEAESGKYILIESETGRNIKYGENQSDNQLIETMMFLYMFPECNYETEEYNLKKYQVKRANSSKKKFKVEIVETYRRYIEVEAEDEDAAYNSIDNQIVEGIIYLHCDGDDYKYERELFVSEIIE